MVTTPIQDTRVTVGAIHLHYVQWGTHGTPIVCVHGLTANAFYFQAIADELSSKHRVIAYDLRGRGDSDKPEAEYSIPTHAADLAQLIEVLELERPILIGHSLGALISLYFAAHYPEKLSKLVLVDAGAPLPWKTAEEQPAWLTASINRLGLPIPSYQEYVDRLKQAPFLGPYWNEYVDTYIKHDVEHKADGSVVAKASRQAILSEGEHINEVRMEEQWSKVVVPTLVLRAGQGLFFNNDQLLSEEAAEAMRANIQHCTYRNFPNVNHYTILFHVEPEPIQTIRAFIDSEE